MNCLQDNHLYQLLTQLELLLNSNCLDSYAMKSLSLSLAKIPAAASALDHSLRKGVSELLEKLYGALSAVLTAQESFKILSIANEPFKRTRRRLPPQAEDELSEWLKKNVEFPYMAEEEIREFSEKFGVEGEQVRVFLTNSRRKMMGGVRKRHKVN
jgi:hypothetical protein